MIIKFNRLLKILRVVIGSLSCSIEAFYDYSFIIRNKVFFLCINNDS